MKKILGITFILATTSTGLVSQLYAQDKPANPDVDLEPAVVERLKQMGTYLRSLKAFQVLAEVSTEDVLADGQKVQFSQKTTLLAQLPDKLMAETNGDLKQRSLFYDGKNFTFFAGRVGYYATAPAPPTIAELNDVVSEKYGIDIPLADLFLWGSPRFANSPITSATDIGDANIGGTTCEHFVLRQPGLDWQIWIQKGDYPLPRKLVLTTTTDDARPQHISVLTWNLAPSYNMAAFTFDPPPGTNKIVFADVKPGN